MASQSNNGQQGTGVAHTASTDTSQATDFKELLAKEIRFAPTPEVLAVATVKDYQALYDQTEGQKVKTWLYGLLSVLLLFTAAIVLNIESVQQTLHLTLDSAYTHVFVPIEALIWVRSLAIVLLIVAHALRHVQVGKPQEHQNAVIQEQQPPQLVITPDLIETLRGMLAQTTVTEEQAAPTLLLTEGEASENNGERVRAYLSVHPTAPLREIADALTISVTTARKWRSRVQEGIQETPSKAR
jgi:hypothetical protein